MKGTERSARLTDVVVGEQMLTSRQIALLTHLSYETVVRLSVRIDGVRSRIPAKFENWSVGTP